MRRCGLLMAVLGAVLLAAPGLTARGASLDLQFIRGLREHGYFDYAIVEIDRLRARPNLSPETAATLEFERALTQLEHGHSLVNAESAAKELDRAAASLEQFATSHPESPLVRKAHAERAKLLLDRAPLEMWRLGPDEPPAKRQAAQARARELIVEARRLFQTALDQAKADYERFPKTKIGDPQAQADRQRAEADYLRVQLDLAKCSFFEGITYDSKTADRRTILGRAAGEFDAINVKHRSQGAGMRALLWEGKCLEEQGEIRKARGIYEELRKRQGDGETVRQVRDQATEYFLACLNDNSIKDYATVVNEATRWLTAAKGSRTAAAIGIRWQRAVAAERLAASPGASTSERERALKSASDDAREVSRYPGEFQSPALALVSRLDGSIRSKSPSRDFAGAFTLARKEMDDIQSLRERWQAAGPEEKAKIDQQLRTRLEGARPRLRQLLATAEPRTDRHDLNRARYFLAFVDLELKNNLESTILGDYTARRMQTVDPELARAAARVALAACEQESQNAAESQRLAIARIARRIAEFMIHHWPDNDQTNEGRFTVGRLYERARHPAQAARWFSGVLPDSDQYAQAQVEAGREYWIAAQTVPKQVPADGPSRQQQVEKLTALAQEHLERGIAKARDPVDSAGNPPDWLTVGKAALANLDIGLGRYDAAVQLLTGSPHSVTASVAVNDEASRPGEGVKGRLFSSYVYQTLLRAQIGAHRIDESLAAMQSLEKIAGVAGGETVTGIYVSLGKEIQQEIARLIAANDRGRLTEVRKSFEKFLEELSRRSDSMTYGSQLWIAETYAGMGEGLSDDAAAAREYFAKAARAYEQLLSRAAADTSAAGKERLISLRMRMANCLRQQGDYERALSSIRTVIAEKPKLLDVQVAAAKILQDWGAAEPAEESRRSLEAIRGIHDAAGPPIWGWAEIAARLQHKLAGRKSDSDFRDRYFEARYNIPLCRRQFAAAEKDAATRAKVLEVALGEITAFALVATDVSDESWARLDALYREIEKELGRPETLLRRPDPRTVSAQAAAAESAAAATPARAEPPATPVASPAKSTAQPAPTSPFWVLLGVVAIVAGTAAAVTWNFRRQKSPRMAIRSFGSTDTDNLPDLPNKPARASAPRRPPTVKRPARPKQS